MEDCVSKGKKRSVAKKKHEDTSNEVLFDLLDRIVSVAVERKHRVPECVDLFTGVPQSVAANIATEDKPSHKELVKSHFTRMAMQ